MYRDWEEHAAIEGEIRAFVSGVDLEPLRQTVAHSLGRGGKRIRPLVLLLCCELNGGSLRQALCAALSVELVHTASLVQDDIVDGATLRRGRQPADKAFGTLQAVMTSDYLVSRAVEGIAPYGPRVVGWLGAVGRALVEGEVSDYVTRDTKVDEDGYWRLVSLKTARLFELSARIGAEIASPGSIAVEGCGRFGAGFGMAYQLADDLREFKGENPEKHSIYHARTLPRILGERLSADAVVEECRGKIKMRLEVALEALDSFPPSPPGERLAVLARNACEV